MHCLPVVLLMALMVSKSFAFGQELKGVSMVAVDSAWSSNSINTVVFRKNSLVTFQNDQYIAYYNRDSYVVIGKRKLDDTKWQLHTTAFKGNTKDAHNCISIMVDGDGYLHLAWDHHNNKLHYSKSVAPGSLEMSAETSMTGKLETSVSYPEFYRLSSGDLLFFYRDGGSGRGNMVLNYYDTKAKQWQQLQSNLVDGEGKRNAYWQACTDSKGSIHLSWVWRESPDVASNHDMCYARSDDGGKTWKRSTGELYALPITAASAEYAWKIPQRSELINQTSIYADEKGQPFIATYWRDQNDSVPQYRIIYKQQDGWKCNNTAFRKITFSLSGMGTKSIPIARPQLMVANRNNKSNVLLVFRDEERGSKVSVACIDNINNKNWKIKDLTNTSVGSWEPSYDTELWKLKKILHLFVEKVTQVDGEGLVAAPAQMVQVLEWKPEF